MTTIIGGSSPSVTFPDSTVQNTAFTGSALAASPYTTSLGAGTLVNNTGTSHTAIGNSALANNTTASNNTAVGYQSQYSNTTGDSNVSVGGNSFYTNTTGLYNSAIGYSAMYYNTTGSYNTALGRQALVSNTTASNNTAVGYQAGYSNTTANSNTFLGYQAGLNVTGNGNTLLGFGAGAAISTGTNNIVLGSFSGNSGIDIRTANNYIVFANGAANGDWKAYSNSTNWYQNNNSSSWATTSDARIKENVKNIENGLAIITALRPVEFDYIISKQHTEGFIAQEYEQILPNQITSENATSEDLKALTNGEPIKSIQQNLVPYLVKAIQELKAEVDSLKQQLAGK
jgi:hypothetical protein